MSKKITIIIIALYWQGSAILLDTPGIGGSGEASLRLKEYIPDALFVIFVINVGNAGGIQHDRVKNCIITMKYQVLQK